MTWQRALQFNDYTLLLAAIVADKSSTVANHVSRQCDLRVAERWYETALDDEGCPVLTDEIRRALNKAMRTKT